MFPGESPGRSRLELLGRRSAYGGSSGMADDSRVTKINHFYNGKPAYYSGAKHRAAITPKTTVSDRNAPSAMLAFMIVVRPFSSDSFISFILSTHLLSGRPWGQHTAGPIAQSTVLIPIQTKTQSTIDPQAGRRRANQHIPPGDLEMLLPDDISGRGNASRATTNARRRPPLTA